MQILGFMASLTFLVVTHELGHFTFAKIFKTRVDQFYVFFNPGFSILKMKRFDGKFHFKFFATKSPDEWANHPEHTEWGTVGDIRRGERRVESGKRNAFVLVSS